MNDLRYLEAKRLIKELEFVESDYLYQSEVIEKNEPIFLNTVESVVTKFPQLNEFWKIKNPTQLENINSSPNDELKDEQDLNMKKLYREIVKSTHPDKISNLKLNNLYIESTNAYENGDIVTLYRVCNDLMIDFKWGEVEIGKIKNRIQEVKGKIKFLESTYTYKWIMSKKKEDIVLDYIKNQLA